MAKNLEQASALLKKARDDCRAASCLADGKGISLWTVGFHAQQAVEKSLKAVLMLHGVPYPFTHDLSGLIRIIAQEGLTMPPGHDELPYLTPFAALFRYEDEQVDAPASMDASRLLQWAESTLMWAESFFEDA